MALATIRKRNGKFQVQVRRSGHAPRAQSFLTRTDAVRWARAVELELDRALIPGDTQPLGDVTVESLLTRYRNTVTVHKRGAASERKRIEVFLRYGWARLPLSRLSPSILARHRDKRVNEVGGGTVLRELGLLHSVFETARKEWDVPLSENPIGRLKKPTAPEGRTRRLRTGELAALLEASAQGRNAWLRTAILFAIESGMRRGELLNMRWKDVDTVACTLSIPVTKTGVSRCIPLTDAAVRLLGTIKPALVDADARIFPVSANAFRLCWERCKHRANKFCPGVLSLRFHDLRHEAVSRFFELGLSVAEVALISGHRDLRMLFRYTHLRPEAVGQKLRRMTGVEVAS
jgi:integrase